MEAEPSKCPICLDVFECCLDANEELEIHRTRCGHAVHRTCLRNLIRSGSYSCSICRTSFGDVQSELEQPHLKRYVKMLHQKLPMTAVRQRMEVDGILPEVVDAFFTGGASTGVRVEQDSETDRISVPRDTATFAKFLKIGMNEAAVRQKMENAGFKEVEIDKFFCEYIDRPDCY